MSSPRRIHLAVATLAVMAVVGSPLAANDWPQWRGPNRDNKLVGFKLPATWPKELKQQWKVPVGLGEASPALVGDRIFTFGRQGNDEIVQCLDATTGKVIWQDKYDATTQFTGDRGHSGPRSSVAVGNGKVCTLGVAGMLSCYEANSGKVVWRQDSKEFPMPHRPRFHSGMSPIIVDGLCIAHLGADKVGAIVAYDLNNGSEKWRWADDAPSYGSPVIAEIGGTRQLITPTQSRLVGISVADGKLLWSLEYMGGRMYNSGTPIVDGSNVYIVGDAKVIGVKVESQGGALSAKELWSLKTHTSRFTTPVLKDGQLYGVNSQGALYCLKGETGEQVWQDTSQVTPE
jgi:outer membrane protein assembly factor BamB